MFYIDLIFVRSFYGFSLWFMILATLDSPVHGPMFMQFFSIGALELQTVGPLLPTSRPETWKRACTVPVPRTKLLWAEISDIFAHSTDAEQYATSSMGQQEE